MKHCFQRRFAFLLVFILLCASASAAAEVKTWQLSEENTTIYYEMTRFDAELPDVLMDAMSKTQWAGWQCEKGIRQDKREKDSKKLIKGAALAAVQKDGKTMLLQFVCPDGKTWSCFPAAEEKALLPGRSYEFDAILARTFPHVEITYPCGDGGCEKFRLILTYTEKEPVIFENYRREYPDGSETVIGSGKSGDSLFGVETTSASGEFTVEYDEFYFYPKWLEALDANQYPKSKDEAQSYVAANPHSVPNGYGLLSGSNMREKTSTQSKKLGIYHNATLVKILGIEPGTSNPWYKVQAGQTVGYISEPYIGVEKDGFIPSNFYDVPPAAGRANKDCELKTSTIAESDTAAKVTAGTEMYVLADYGDWLHVLIPQGEVGYWMDINGAYGYLRTQDVTQADTPLRLKYTED